MATIGQICAFMNENKLVWHPQVVVDVRVEKLSETEFICRELRFNQLGRDAYRRVDNQKYIGHYYQIKNEGNGFRYLILFPLNNGRYLKAKVI